MAERVELMVVVHGRVQRRLHVIRTRGRTEHLARHIHNKPGAMAGLAVHDGRLDRRGLATDPGHEDGHVANQLTRDLELVGVVGTNNEPAVAEIVPGSGHTTRHGLPERDVALVIQAELYPHQLLLQLVRPGVGGTAQHEHALVRPPQEGRKPLLAHVRAHGYGISRELIKCERRGFFTRVADVPTLEVQDDGHVRRHRVHVVDERLERFQMPRPEPEVGLERTHLPGQRIHHRRAEVEEARGIVVAEHPGRDLVHAWVKPGAQQPAVPAGPLDSQHVHKVTVAHLYPPGVAKTVTTVYRRQKKVNKCAQHDLNVRPLASEANALSS